MDGFLRAARDVEMRPFFEAAKSGSIELIRRGIRDVDYTTKEWMINWENKSSWTPLIVSCLNGHYDIAKYLLEHGAKVNKIDKYGMSALLYACQSNRKDIAALLLEYEADWSVTCSGRSANDYAIANGWDFEGMKKLGMEKRPPLVLDKLFVCVVKEDSDEKKSNKRFFDVEKKPTYLQHFVKSVYNADIFFTELVVPYLFGDLKYGDELAAVEIKETVPFPLITGHWIVQYLDGSEMGIQVDEHHKFVSEDGNEYTVEFDQEQLHFFWPDGTKQTQAIIELSDDESSIIAIHWTTNSVHVEFSTIQWIRMELEEDGEEDLQEEEEGSDHEGELAGGF